MEKNIELDKKIEENQPTSKIDFFYINKHIKINPEKCFSMLKNGAMSERIDPRLSIITRSKSEKVMTSRIGTYRTSEGENNTNTNETNSIT